MESTAVTAGGSAESAFGCIACKTTLASLQEQKEHMKCEWHVYNLKRKIASLEPISAQVFTDQVSAGNSHEQQEFSCVSCRKAYTSAKQLRSHLRSQKHRLAIEQEETVQAPTSATLSPPHQEHTAELMESDAEVSDESSDSSSSNFEFNLCLFCNSDDADSLADSLTHMGKTHGFFIPEQDHLIDLETFIAYLSLLITEFHECLSCGVVRGTTEAIQHHMIDRGHCTINFDQRSRLEDFYDFPEGRARVAIGASDRGSELQLLSGKVLRHRSHGQGSRQHRLSRQAISDTHSKSLLEASETSEDAPGTSASNVLGPAQAPSKALTTRSTDAQGLIGISAMQQRSLRVVERKMVKMEMRARQEYQRKVEKMGNRQKHFVSDVPGPKLG